MALEVRGLRVRYGRMLAVEDVSLRVAPGQLVAVVGSNGAGKTTTVKAISGLVRPEGGSITFDGQPLTSLPAHVIARLGICQVPEGRGLLGSLTVAENLRLGSYGRRPGSTTMDLAEVLAFFPILKDRMSTSALVLSGGEQQMLSLARALLKGPRILMIDEMSLGLAPKLVHQLMEVVLRLRDAGIGVLCVEQNTRLVLSNADYAYVISTGKTVLEGPGPELLNDPRVANAYLGTTQAI